jgi:hypothetical protein
MRLLYLPNEPVEGWQVGARTALALLRERGVLSDLAIYSFLLAPPREARAEILAHARAHRPDVILFAKLGQFELDAAFLQELRAAAGRPLLVYYDGDVYGRVFKRLTAPTRLMCREADLVFLCGLGDHAKLFEQHGAKRILYLPHNASSVQFGAPWTPTARREFDVVLIGNRIRGRHPIQERFRWARMPGVHEREMLVRRLGEVFGERFAVFGRGWDGFVGNQGPIAFDRQHEALRRSWLSVGYDHFPGIPFYFSDRLPIALMSGVAHVTHFHPGYDALFENGRELLWSTTVEGLVDAARVALGRGPEYLDALGTRGRAYASRHLTTEVVFSQVIDAIAAVRAGRPVAPTFPPREP